MKTMNILKNEANDAWLDDIKNNYLNSMKNAAEKTLNPKRYHLSEEARKRLYWLWVIDKECGGNVTVAARKVGITRQWLSEIKNLFETRDKDPRVLEPKSKAPRNTKNRKRIPKETEDKILEVRAFSKNAWGKQKISRVLIRDHKIKASPNTVNKYLHKHKKIDPKISLKNTKAWQAKKAREEAQLCARYRPPKQIKDYAPGALMEKDIKFVPIPSRIVKQGKSGDSFWSQHTSIDSLTRIRVLELTKGSGSEDSVSAYKNSKDRLPFPIACENTDNGSENKHRFREELQKENIFQFYSNSGTPTDNPRVERSHLTDQKEFYEKGGIKKTFEEQKEALTEWENTYNFKRPHQALGYLTPVEFHELWKKDKNEAQKIVNKYQKYLLKQKIRLAGARKIKRQDQIEKLMRFIDVKLNKTVGIIKAKNELIDCQLCSMA